MFLWAWNQHHEVMAATLVSITLLAWLFSRFPREHHRSRLACTLLLAPQLYHHFGCNFPHSGVCATEMVYALRSSPYHLHRLWCDFDVVSSRLPPPFPSLRLSQLVASAVSGLRTLFVWFCFFCFCYPTTRASAFLTSKVVTRRPFAPSLPSWRVLFFLWKGRESNPQW